jgi:hypothetical protein
MKIPRRRRIRQGAQQKKPMETMGFFLVTYRWVAAPQSGPATTSINA